MQTRQPTKINWFIILKNLSSFIADIKSVNQYIFFKTCYYISKKCFTFLIYHRTHNSSEFTQSKGCCYFLY